MTNINRRLRIQELKKNYLKVHECVCCGAKENLTFHHVNPEDKSFNIGSKNQMSVTDFFKEAEKCVILCDDCHKKYHLLSKSL